MRISKVTTRQGDGGRTRLVGGQQVDKDDARVEANGAIDELNAVLGTCRATFGGAGEVGATLDGLLASIQNDLFDCGGEIATRPADRWPGMRRMGDADVARLEASSEAMNAQLPPLTEFVLPAGDAVVAHLHVARTVARRAERRVVTLVKAEPETELGVVTYLNRLSDLLFVASRWAARQRGQDEVVWRRS